MKSITEEYPILTNEISNDIQVIIDVTEDCINQSDMQDLRFIRTVAIALKRRFKELTD